MKYTCLIFIILLFTACSHSQGDIELAGIANGVNFGNVSVNDVSNITVYKTRIQSGKFTFGKQFLQSSGYYKLAYTLGGAATRHVDIYLEPGTYTVSLDQQKINNYPLITSSSKRQNQLSAYYAIADSVNAEARKKVIALNTKINGLKDQLLKPGEYTVLAANLRTQELKANEVDELNIFNIFMKKYPDNEVAAHLMLQMDYQDDAVGYYKMFENFSSSAKNSNDGKELESKLKPLVKMTTGELAPVIAGTTPDAKTLNIKDLNKKIILLDFWRSTNGSSRDNHQQMITDLLPQYDNGGLEIISVSLDTEKGKWLAAIAHDKMNWPQLSDLKGDDSPNAENWVIKSIPSYYLLDGRGRIIKHVSAYNDVAAVINNYLKYH